MKGMLMASCTILIVTLGCSLAGLGSFANGSFPSNAPSAEESANGSRAGADGANLLKGAGTTVSTRDQEIVDSLKEGGYVILLQSSATNGSNEQVSASDDPTQNQVQEFSDAIRKLSVPVGHVFSSPDPGTLEASNRGFGHDQVETTEVLRLRDTSGVQVVDELGAGLRQLLSIHPSTGKNTILVSTIPGTESSKEAGAETVILKPLGSGNFQRVALLTTEQWAELAGSIR